MLKFLQNVFVFIPPPPHHTHDSAWVLWFHIAHPCVCPSVIHPSIHILFPDNKFSKCQWIFTSLGMCIDIIEIWFGIAIMVKFCQFWHSCLPITCPYFCFQIVTWVNISGFSPNLVCALILWRSGLGLLMDKLHQFWTEVICPPHDSSGYYNFMFLCFWINIIKIGYNSNIPYPLFASPQNGPLQMM